MKTILVLASHPELAEAVRAALDPERYQVVHRLNSDDAEPMLEHALFNACVVDAEVADSQGTWLFEKIHRRIATAPILVYCDEGPWRLEEEAYLAGVKHILRKPVRQRLLEAVLEQTLGSPPSPRARPISQSSPPGGRHERNLTQPVGEKTVCALQKWHRFSSLLSNSLSAEVLLKQFLLQLREIMGVNRAAIFLRQPILTGGSGVPGAGRFMRSACSIGLDGGVIENLELSLETGLGGYAYRNGRILSRVAAEEIDDSEIEREFALLGVQVVVPIFDRQTLVGLAAFDERVTGGPLSNEELELVFHVLEEVGLAVRNVWFHDQLVANQQMLSNVLRQFSSGCVVVGRDLNILHCNDTGRRFLFGTRRDAELQFSDLPVVLGSKVYQVLKAGAALAPFRFQPADKSKAVYQVSIVPLQSRPASPPDSALMVIEDRTQMEQLHQLELETTNLRLVKSMADRLAHEIGNALVPISTHQQLIADQYLDPDFRASLDIALADGVKRISRFLNQMRFLARDSLAAEEKFPLGPLVEEAFREAQTHQPAQSALLKYDDASHQPTIVSGDRAALKHAFLEVFLNALQANPTDPKISVRLRPSEGFSSSGRRWAQVEVLDNGGGFSNEALAKVPSPFYTTRTVGLGLGLTVTRKIIETHHGQLQIVQPTEAMHGVVRILLPLSAG